MLIIDWGEHGLALFWLWFYDTTPGPHASDVEVVVFVGTGLGFCCYVLGGL